jgi:hypothetical protein
MRKSLTHTDEVRKAGFVASEPLGSEHLHKARLDECTHHRVINPAISFGLVSGALCLSTNRMC